MNSCRGEKVFHRLVRPVKIFTSLKEYRGDVRSDSIHVGLLALKKKKTNALRCTGDSELKC